MTYHPRDDTFDLSQIFIGREHQLDSFEIYLQRWKKLIRNTDPKSDPVITAPTPNNKIQGLVVLLYGRGGFGKSTLLQHYHAMAQQPEWNLAVSKVVDWEFAVEDKRSIFNPLPGQEVDAGEFFRELCFQLATALGKHPREFKEYQEAVIDLKEIRKQVSAILNSMEPDDSSAELRNLGIDGVVGLLRTLDPTPFTILLNNEKIKQVIDTAVKFTSDQKEKLRKKLRDKLGHKYRDYLEPALRLGLSLGRDLDKFAKDFPLLLFFDTYEEIDEADKFLRIVMGAAGVRVGWVIAGRDPIWAGSEQRRRKLDVEYGYKEIVPADRGLAIDFNTGGIGAFTLSDIMEYFSQLNNKVQYSLTLPAVMESDAVLILELTQGVPLAVKIAAGLYLERADLQVITEKADGKSKQEVVEGMVRRYLLHTHADQSERAKLYGLALLRRVDEPVGVVAALGLSPEQAATTYEAELSRLHRRYSFIFTEQPQPTLHMEVRYFLRLWLFEHRRDPEIVAISNRLKEAHEVALKRLEDRRQYGSLKGRLEDDEWIGVYLDLTEQQFWIDPFEGVRYILPFMIAMSIYWQDVYADAEKLGQLFETSMDRRSREWWQWAVEGLAYPSPEVLNALKGLLNLTGQGKLVFPQPLSDYKTELEALLWWQLGKAYQYEEDEEAILWYEKALTRLDQEEELREAAANAYRRVFYNRYREKNYTECLFPVNRIIELLPDAIAYRDRGHVYSYLREYEQAIKDYERSIELDSTQARAYSGLGFVHVHLQEYELALEELNHAIELDHAYARSYHNRGWIYTFLQENERALEDINLAIKLEPTYPRSYSLRGILHLRARNIEQAKADFNQATDQDPKYTRGAWMRCWADMDKQCNEIETAEQLEMIAQNSQQFDQDRYLKNICWGVALGLRGKLKEGLAKLEQTDPPPELLAWNLYFWRGILCAYYYQGRPQLAIEMIEKALGTGMPPALLTPLYWLKKDRLEFFEKYARPLLKKYEV